VLGSKAEKIYFIFFYHYFLQHQTTVIFFTTPILHHSNTTIQLTSAFDKKADECILPTAVVYTPADEKHTVGLNRR
jgi:hypothetical protein